jgi:hypothetical protein
VVAYQIFGGPRTSHSGVLPYNCYNLMKYFFSEVARPTGLGVEFLRELPMEVIIMSSFSKTLVFSVLFLVVPVVMAGDERDCLLEGTVQHGKQAGQESTMVNIDSISKYDEESRCAVRRGQKLEFKLPQDSRLQEAPSGSSVKYRYRTDDSGQSNSELISIGT